MTTISAVYEGGVLRPTEPLDLRDGDEVWLTVSSAKASPRPTAPSQSMMRPPTPEEAAYIRGLDACKSVQEMFAFMAANPVEDEPYDIERWRREAREFAGELPISPPPEAE